MLALDTNVRVRYLAQDDAKQSALATQLVEDRLSPADRGFVSLVTLLATVWGWWRAATARTPAASQSVNLATLAQGCRQGLPCR